jgi:hypothetical protein
MMGIRAFGRNEGTLNHTGDFRLLFSPLLPELESLAVYGIDPGEGLYFPFDLEMDDLDEADDLSEALFERLNKLDICPEPRPETGVIYPRYYKSGFFPDFANYIQDDWNDLICFQEPYPDYMSVLRAVYGEIPFNWEAIKARHAEQQRREIMATGFQFYFRNIDACWWEVFSPRQGSIDRVVQYLCEQKIAFQTLEFERDFPDSQTPVNREFRDVHYFESPGDE